VRVCEIAEFFDVDVDFERWQYTREFRGQLRVREDCVFKVLVFEVLKICLQNDGLLILNN